MGRTRTQTRPPQGADRPLSGKRAVVFALATPVLLLVMVELLLRCAGAIYLSTSRPELEFTEDSIELWAFGDSFAFGLGADDPQNDSYPAVVGRELERALGRSVQVRNHGVPGHTSTQQIDRMSERLGPGVRPDLILVTVGINDGCWLAGGGPLCWPDALLNGDRFRAPQFIVRLRTYRLLRNVISSLRDQEPGETGRTPQCDALERGFSLLNLPDPIPSLEVFSGLLALDSGALWPRLGAAMAEYRSGHPGPAAVHFRRLVEQGVQLWPVSLYHALAAGAAGEADEARVALDRARQAGADPQRRVLVGAWLHLYAGRSADAVTAFEEVLTADRIPPSVEVSALDGRAWGLLGMGRFDDAAAAFEAEARRLSELNAANGPWRPFDGWRDIGRAWLQTREGSRESHTPLLHRASSDPSTLPSIQDMESAQRDGLQPAVPRPLPLLGVRHWVRDDAHALRPNLQRALRAARTVGAPLVLVDYPQPSSGWVADAMQEVGAQAGALYIDPAPRLEEALRSRPRGELFVADGHPTSAGYELVGAHVAGALAALPTVDERPEAP